MKLRFEQPNGMQCGHKTYQDEKIPAGVPPAWQIDQWKKRRPEVDRPQPQMEIDDRPPPNWSPEDKKKDDVERGVVIMEF